MSLRALTAILVAAASPASAQQPSKEASTVAAQVLAKADWVADASLCPAQVMLEREVPFQSAIECKPGGFAACLSRCSSGSGFHCYWLAYALQGQGIGQTAYEPLYQRACKLGVTSGCTNRAAGMLVRGKVDTVTDACTAETFAKACAFDDPWACTMYASALGRGAGVKQDKAAALKALEKSCKYGPDDGACIYAMRIKKELLGTK